MFMRIQFVPHIRRALGWRGLIPVERFPGAWTARLAARGGIFGLDVEQVRTDGRDWAQASCRIHHFPAAGDRLWARYGEAARRWAATAGFRERIREFPAHPALAAAFDVGEFSFAVRRDGRAAALGARTVPGGVRRRRHPETHEATRHGCHAGSPGESA